MHLTNKEVTTVKTGTPLYWYSIVVNVLFCGLLSIKSACFHLSRILNIIFSVFLLLNLVSKIVQVLLILFLTIVSIVIERCYVSCIFTAPIDNFYWLDSTLYEVFVTPQTDIAQIITNFSLITTHGICSSVSDGVHFNLAQSFNLMLVDFSSTLDNFTDENDLNMKCKMYGVISNSSIPLGDHVIEVQVVQQDKVLTNSDIVIHVVDPIPTSLPTPGKILNCIEFYILFLLLSDLCWLWVRQLLCFSGGFYAACHIDIIREYAVWIF